MSKPDFEGAVATNRPTPPAFDSMEAGGASAARRESEEAPGTTAALLKVQGASIYHERRGAGPLLLIIPGGPQDAGVFAELSHLLADRYTVVSYDPRGNSRSRFDGEPEALQLDVQGDDAAALIGALGKGRAYVFGTCGGGQIGFNVGARYPQLVQTLVAHEPPALLMLEDPAAALAAEQRVHDTYLKEGVDAAMALFFGINGLAGEAGEEGTPPEFDLPPEAAETFARVSSNFEYWLAHGMMPLSLYRPDVEALHRGLPRVIVGIGEQSAGQMIHDVGIAVAERLGTQAVTFPGDHIGFAQFAEAFAGTLDRLFSARETP